MLPGEPAIFIVFESWDYRGMDCRGKDYRRNGFIIKTWKDIMEGMSLPIPLNCVIMLLQHSIFVSILLFCVSCFVSA